MNELKVKFYPASKTLNRCMEIWRQIYNGETTTEMVSPEWMETFFDVFREITDDGVFLVVEEGNSPVGITYFGRKMRWRNGFIFSKTMNMNTSGNRKTDDVLWIEHNGICCCKSKRESIIRAILDALMADASWDEVYFPGLSVTSLLPGEIKAKDGQLIAAVVLQKKPDYIVDLNLMRQRGLDYLGMVNRATRYNVRKVLKHYDLAGASSVETAGCLGDALKWLRDIGRLNTERMKKIGKVSSFESEDFVRFHEEYIRRAFTSGQVIMQKITAGSQIVGFHYNIICGKRLHFYQCGYNYEDQEKISTGIYCLYQNILWAAKNGFEIFDFLSGDDKYKRDLSNSSIAGHMEWLKLKRRRIRFKLEDSCRDALNYIHEITYNRGLS